MLAVEPSSPQMLLVPSLSEKALESRGGGRQPACSMSRSRVSSLDLAKLVRICPCVRKSWATFWQMWRIRRWQLFRYARMACPLSFSRFAVVVWFSDWMEECGDYKLGLRRNAAAQFQCFSCIRALAPLHLTLVHSVLGPRGNLSHLGCHQDYGPVLKF